MVVPRNRRQTRPKSRARAAVIDDEDEDDEYKAADDDDFDGGIDDGR